MKALISPFEPRLTGYRVVQIVDDHLEFEVAEPLFWIEAININNPCDYWYDPTDETIKLQNPPQDITEE